MGSFRLNFTDITRAARIFIIRSDSWLARAIVVIVVAARIRSYPLSYMNYGSAGVQLRPVSAPGLHLVNLFNVSRRSLVRIRILHPWICGRTPIRSTGYKESLEDSANNVDIVCSSLHVIPSSLRLANSGFGHSGTPSPPFPSHPSFPPPRPPSLSREALPPIPARESGEGCKLPQWVWGEAPADKRFGAYLQGGICRG